MKDKKQKVLVLANDTTYTYNLRDQLLEALNHIGYEVVIASKLLFHQEELQQIGCRLINVETDRHGTNPLSDLVLLRKYLKILKNEKPYVVLTYNIKPNVYGGIACRLTHTHYLPNITGLGTAVEYPGPMQKLTVRLYKAGVVGADCVFFQNEENRQFFRDHHMLRKNARTKMLPGSGVNLEKHLPLPYPPDDGVTHFLFIARIMKEKGIDLYLNAARTIYESNKNVMFHICGQCDDSAYLKLLEKAQKEGYIQYHGEQKDLIPFFKMAHCIVHPSYYPEGMSNVLLEAAAHARPIIATDRSGCRETVEDGKTGYVIPIKDEKELVDALGRFLHMSWKQKSFMGIAGRRKMEQEFDRKLVVNEYLLEIRNNYYKKHC